MSSAYYESKVNSLSLSFSHLKVASDSCQSNKVFKVAIRLRMQPRIFGWWFLFLTLKFFSFFLCQLFQETSLWMWKIQVESFNLLFKFKANVSECKIISLAVLDLKRKKNHLLIELQCRLIRQSPINYGTSLTKNAVLAMKLCSGDQLPFKVEKGSS